MIASFFINNHDFSAIKKAKKIWDAIHYSLAMIRCNYSCQNSILFFDKLVSKETLTERVNIKFTREWNKRQRCFIGTEIIILTVRVARRACTLFFRSMVPSDASGFLHEWNEREKWRERENKKGRWKMRHDENGERSEQCRTRDSGGDNCYRFLSRVCKPVAKYVSTNVSCCLRPFQLNGSIKRCYGL